MDNEKPMLSNGPSKMENPMYGNGDGIQHTPIASAMGGVPSEAYTATVKSK